MVVVVDSPLNDPRLPYWPEASMATRLKSPEFICEVSISCEAVPASSLENSRLPAYDMPDGVKSPESWAEARLLALDLSRPFFFFVC